MKLIHYQTLEAVDHEELRALRAVKGKFNEQRSFWERIKLWEKSDILEELEPKGARWGFTRVRDDQDRLQVLFAIRRMSQVTPRLTWVLYDDGNGGKEVLLRGGKCVA